MKLRNKKTGEIGNFCYGHTNELCISWQKDDGFWDKQEYKSLAELNADWEDAPEEPKDYYFIRSESLTVGYSPIRNTRSCRNRKTIGNYFETEEEAEKAVEKLKAFKRLKDKGMIKYSFHKEKRGIDLDFYILTILAPRDEDSLNLLFGGEE